MNRLIFSCALISFLSTAYAAEPDKPVLYHHNLVEGVIFPASKKAFSYNTTSTWTPSVSDINKIESLLLPALKKYAVKDSGDKVYNYTAKITSPLNPLHYQPSLS